MRYPSGELVEIGDSVELWPGCHGEVVCSIDNNQYSDEFTAADWSYLKQGVLVRSGQAGLIHYIEPETTMRLLKRAGKTSDRHE
jgi:hypothetical protein